MAKQAKKKEVKRDSKSEVSEVISSPEINLSGFDVANIENEVLLISHFQDKKHIDTSLRKLDSEFGGILSNAVKNGFLKGEIGEVKSLYVAERNLNLVVIGFGEESKLTLEIFTDTMSNVFRGLREGGYKKIGVYLEGLPINNFNDEIGLEKLVFSSLMGLYGFNDFRTKNIDKIKFIQEINFLSDKYQRYKKPLLDAMIVAEAVNKTRDLVNTPPNVANPEYVADYSQDMAKENKIKCQILEENDLKKLGMNCLLAVSSGSVNKPKFVVLEYKNGGSKDPIVLVGKGVTFDSGGLNIKPHPHIQNMKDDKAGACVVVHVLEAAAKLKLGLNVIGIMPLVENMPSGTSYRPDDVIVAHNGMTVEVKNTDAEGRMILADSLSYSLQYKPQAIIDIATLTGATKIVLGPYGTPILGNDDHLISRIKNASVKSLEKVWEMPLWKEYNDELKSEIADVSHLSNEGNAGTTIGAAFLKNFVGDAKWAHLDIGSTCLTKMDKGVNPKGVTGVSVRLLIELLRSWS